MRAFAGRSLLPHYLTFENFCKARRLPPVMSLVCIAARRASSSAPDLSLNGWLHERRNRLACLDDISRQHPPGFRAEVSRIMRGPRGDQESIACVQYYGGTSLYPHLDLACDDVADLLSWMNVPSGFDSRRNQRLDLHHLAAW